MLLRWRSELRTVSPQHRTGLASPNRSGTRDQKESTMRTRKGPAEARAGTANVDWERRLFSLGVDVVRMLHFTSNNYAIGLGNLKRVAELTNGPSFPIGAEFEKALW